MASNANVRAEISALNGKIQQMLVKQLQQICGTSGLRTSGVKADLQRRIVESLYESSAKDLATYNQLKDSINNIMPGSRAGGGAHNPQRNGASTTSYSRGGVHASNHMAANSHVSQSGFGQSGFNFGVHGRGGYGGGSSGAAPHRLALAFKPCPLYRVEELIGEVRTLEVMAQHRSTVTVQLRASDNPKLSLCVNDKTMRVMILCASECAGGGRPPQDISFPHQSEIKVNGGEVKANLRGLKGKSGSTLPADITSSLRLDKYSYVNNVEITYALTNKKFYFGIYLCKRFPVDELVTKIKSRKIPKASVVKELTKAALDPDVVATSQVTSLKCPLTYARLVNPCRSTTCSHISCFDATSYLHLQEQGPQWLCPICNKVAAFDNLAIDEYIKEILDQTKRDEPEQVTIEPDGHWSVEGSAPEPRKSRVSAAASAASVSILDDDDIVAFDDYPIMSGRATQTPNQSMVGTPSGAFTTASSSTPNGSSRKRTSEVIDLTLDSDDDDEPLQPPPKRQHLGLNPTLTSTPEWPNDYTFPHR